METPSNTPVPYMLFFRNSGPENHAHLSAEQRQLLMTRWNSWYDNLSRQGKAIAGEPLEMEARLVSGPNGQRVVDGPFVEAKEAIAGYVILMVQDLDEATRIAQAHPGMEYGLVIEVREMNGSCHLGVTPGRSAADLAKTTA